MNQPTFDPHHAFWRFDDLGEDLRYERRRIPIEAVALSFPHQIKPLDLELVERLRHHYQVLSQELSPIVVSEEVVVDPRFESPQPLFVIQDGHHRFRALRTLYEENPRGPFKEIEVIVVSAINPNSRWVVSLSGVLLNLERREVTPLERVLAFFHYLHSCVQTQVSVEYLLNWCLQLRQNLALAKSKMEQRYPAFLEDLRYISPGDNDFAVSSSDAWTTWFLQHYHEHFELIPHLETLLSPLGRAVLVWLEPIAKDPASWLDSLQAVHRQLGHQLFIAVVETRAPHSVVRALTQLKKTDISSATLIELLYRPDGFMDILKMAQEMARPSTTSAPQLPELILDSASKFRRSFRQLNRLLEATVKQLTVRDLKRSELVELLHRYHEIASTIYLVTSSPAPATQPRDNQPVPAFTMAAVQQAPDAIWEMESFEPTEPSFSQDQDDQELIAVLEAVIESEDFAED